MLTMEEAFNASLVSVTEGEIVEGTVIEVRAKDIVVDIGYKSEGHVNLNEFSADEQPEVGAKIEVLIEVLEDREGQVHLSHERAKFKKNWDQINDLCEEGKVLEGRVKDVVKGGLIVDIGVEAFLPSSQIDIIPPKDLETFRGEMLEFKIVKLNLERQNIVLSRRELIEEERAKKRVEILETMEPGMVIKGKVKNITDFGAFIDLDGLDGLLHITDMSWGRIKHPSEIASVGDELDVVILDVDQDRERVSLGLKQTMPNPWDEIDTKFPIGSRLRGKVVNLVPYGAFVELETGVEGLVHVSEISWTKRIARASDVLSPGQDVDVVVLNINKEEQKIALGIRQTEENPWDTVHERYPVGSRVKGVVRNFTSYGAFIELEDGIDGMVHISDMSWTRKINHPSELLTKGENVEAVVLEVDPGNTRISLGVKQAQEDPWNTIIARYDVGQIVKGTVSKVASFGAFVEIEEGIDGLVHISQISDDHVERVKDVLAAGKEIEARIVRIDRNERRIGLSMKAAEMPEEEFQKQKDELLEGLRPGEDMVDLAGAFDEAIGPEKLESEEWRPGETESEEANAEDPEGTKPQE